MNLIQTMLLHLASFPREKAVKNNPVEAAHTMGQGLARSS